MAVLTISLDRPLDLERTLAPLRHGPSDPTIRLTAAELWRASRTPVGPASLHLRVEGRTVLARSWGPGADWELAGLPDLIGQDDHPEALRPAHPLVAELARRFAGVRLTRTGRMVEALLPAVCEQKVTGLEARRTYQGLIRAFGEPAPEPPGGPGLLLPPAPERLAHLPYHAFHPLGLERRRAEVLQRIGAHAEALEAAVAMAPDAARARLMVVPGIGPWTAAEATRVALGDPDAVSLGDYGQPALVAWALAGEREADDARMLELLAPYPGQRARVITLLELGRSRPPRRGPRLAARRIEAL